MKSLTLAFALVASALAAAQSPITYSMENGQGQANNGAFDYWDQPYTGSGSAITDGDFLSGGLGQLTDGIVGGDDWSADLGSGPAYEWLGWITIDPTITFDYGAVVNLDSMQFHSNNNGQGGVFLWDSIDFSFSDDGTTWTGELTRTTSQAERDDLASRYLQVDLGGVDTRYVRMHVHRQPSTWTFISEITTDQPVPEPASLAVLGLGLAALARRRSV